MAKWTCTFGAQLGLSHASRCLPSYFLHPKLRKIDAVLITRVLITLPLRRLQHTVNTSRSPKAEACAGVHVGSTARWA